MHQVPPTRPQWTYVPQPPVQPRKTWTPKHTLFAAGGVACC